MVRALALVAICCAVRLRVASAGHAPTAVVRCRGLSREVLYCGLRGIHRLIVASRLQPCRLLLFAVARWRLRAGSGVVGMLAATLVAFVFLIAILSSFNQAAV